MVSEFTYADAASLTIAVAAVAIAVWSGYLTRRHNRLSVAPRLRINHRFRGVAGGYGVRIVNAGLGPAIVTSIDLYRDGTLVTYSHQGWMDALNDVGLKSRDWAITRMLVGTVVQAGEQVWLFRAEELPEEANSVIRGLSHLEVVVRYTSLYGEEHPQFRSHLANEDLIIEDRTSTEVS